MSRRRRTLLLTVIALALPLPAYSLASEALGGSGPTAMSVSTSLGGCGVMGDGVVCRINVSFSSVPNASSYSASVTRADGTVMDYGSVSPGGTTIYVPYVGAGSYSVRITAYGDADPATGSEDGDEVIATGTSSRDTDGDQAPANDSSATDEHGSAQAGPSPTDPAAVDNADADGTGSGDAAPSQVTPPADETGPTTTTTTTATTPTCTPSSDTRPPTPPTEPPADLDPENPDEDGDGISDADEQAAYQQQLAEYQAALAAQTTQEAGC